jgi:hypothetical protein
MVTTQEQALLILDAEVMQPLAMFDGTAIEVEAR